MVKLVLLFLGFLFPLITFGQVELSREHDKVILIGNEQVKAIYTGTEEGFSAVLKKDFIEPYNRSFIPESGKVVWLKFQALNTDSFSEAYYVYVLEAYSMVCLQTDTGWQIQKNGYLRPLWERDYKKNTFFIPVKLKPFQPKWIYIRLQSGNYEQSFDDPELCNKMQYYEILYRNLEYNQPGTIFTLIYLSVLIAISFFILVLFISIRESVYVYYLFYLLFQILYSLLIFARTPLKFLNIALYFPVVGYAIVEGVQFLFVGFYIFFILKLLEVKAYDWRLSRAMQSLAWICFAYAAFSIVYNSFFPDPDTIDWIFTIARFVILPINLLLICWVIIKVKHPLIPYFIVGNLFFFAGSVLSVYVSFTGLNQNAESIFYFGNSLNVLFQMGLLGEVLCFSFAIAHHVKRIQLDKKKSALSYIKQLQENQQIQETMNNELDKKVNEKTDELIRVYSDMEKRREKEIKFEFSQKIKGMEMLVLRAQMNPHFLFNSMNSIKHLIMTGRTESAMNYLDDFSSLLRSILQNSKRETITVEDELELLELYLSLEKGRLGEGLFYSITSDDKEALSQYQIPALLLQPFVENAIWHGLMPSEKKDKLLKINFSLKDNLVITIQDNGIGRKTAANNAHFRSGFQKSFGIRITQERLALFNHLHDFKIHLQVSDLEEYNSNSGTLVTFTYSI